MINGIAVASIAEQNAKESKSRFSQEVDFLNKRVASQIETVKTLFDKIETLEDQLAEAKALIGSLQTEIKAYEYERNNVRLDHRSLPMRTTGSVSAMRRHRSANYSCEIK